MQSSMLIPHVWLIKPLQPLFRLHPRRRCHFCYHATVGWGGAKTFMFTCAHRIGYIMMISSLALAQYWIHTHTLFMLHYDIVSCTCTILQKKHLMLRSDIFSCTCPVLQTHTHTHSLTLDASWSYDVISFLGQNLSMDSSVAIWQSDNWPTTWKGHGKRAD